MRADSIGWLIGYFVACCPLHYAFNGTWIGGLILSIFGVAVAIILEVFGR